MKSLPDSVPHPLEPAVSQKGIFSTKTYPQGLGQAPGSLCDPKAIIEGTLVSMFPSLPVT